MTLFDIRTDASNAWFLAHVNRGLEGEPGNPYSARFGPVGGPQWWASLDRGELPIEVRTGTVTFAGPRIEEATGEPEDVVELVCGGETTTYDRVGCWVAPFCVGDRVSVTRTVAEVETRFGPMRYQFDLRAEWLPADVTGVA